jgi:hypothetical protein
VQLAASEKRHLTQQYQNEMEDQQRERDVEERHRQWSG